MKKLRKFFIVSVMVLSVIAMSGLVAPSATNAAASTGDLIKMTGNTSVYYLAADGKRYVFPNSTTYFSWYPDFSGVITIPATELQSYPLGGNVTMRPGTKLVKITTNPDVYAVEPNGVLRKIQTEAQATALYGTNWNKRVVDVPDAFFTNYTTGAALATGATPIGSLVKAAGSATVYYYDGTNYRGIATESAFNANRFVWGNVLTVTGTLTAGGTAISTAELVNVSQSGSAVVITGSGLMVSLSASTPAAASVPQNGARIPMAKVNLTAANDGAVTVNSITVNRIGLSSYSQITKVWAEKDGTIVASKKSMNSDDQSILVFSPALTVPAGQTISIDLLAGLNGAAGNIGLSIASASVVSATSASISGSFPINSNLMSPTSYNVASLAITSTSSLAAAVKVGDENVELGRFNVEFNTYGSNTAKDVTINSIMLKNNGVEDLTSLLNLYIEYAGSKVSTSYTINDRYVTFNFASGLPLLKDDGSKLLYIKGDVIAKENSSASDNSFVLNLNKSTDLVGIEKATGFGVNVYDSTSGNNAADNYTIAMANVEAGTASVSKKAGSPSDTSIIKGSEYTMLLANVNVDEAITVDGINVQYLSSNASSTNFENVKVYVNNLLLDSFDPEDLTWGAAHTVAIDSTVTFNAGDNEVKITAKAKTSAAVTSDIKFILSNGGSATASHIFYGMNPEYVVSGNTVSLTGVGGTATGAIFTVAGAQLATVRSDGYSASSSIVQGGADISLGKFTVKASNDNVTVTSITANANGGSVSYSNVSDMKLYVDGTQVGKTTNFGASGVNFSSLNFTIAKDSTKAIELKGTFDSSASGTFWTVMSLNAQDSRGTVITNGNSATTTDFVLKSSGTLKVELGGDTPAGAILASKTSEQEVAQIKFTAIDDSASLTEINVINTAFGSTTVASSSDGVADADARIASIRLYDGTTLIDSFVPVYGEGKFTITNNKIKINANTSKTLSVKVVLNNISNDAAATNKDIHLAVTTVKFKSSAGSESIQGANGDLAILANNFRVRKTVPTVALLALPTTVLTAGDTVISKFTVTADANGDVALRKIVLNTTRTSNATLTALAVGSAVKVNGAYKTVATSTLATTDATSTLTIRFATDEVITAGTSKTFEILANTTVSGQGSESITTKISEDTTYVADSIGETGSFVWSDGASVSTATYSNSYRVSGITTATQVLSK